MRERAFRRCARWSAKREQPQTHIQRPGGFLQQAGELQFGGAHGRIGHVVDQPDMDGGAVMAAAQQELFDPAHSTRLDDNNWRED